VLGSSSAAAGPGYRALGPDLNLLTVFLAWGQPCPIPMDLPGATEPDPSHDGWTDFPV